METSDYEHSGSRPGELSRDELFVADGAAPEEWRRNNALFEYRLIKRTGWVGRLFVIFTLGTAFIALLLSAVSALMTLAD